MNDLDVSFRNAFWEPDFVSQTGFDTLTNQVKDGQKSCKWLEEYFRQRAKMEEEYGKTLGKICK